VNLRSTVAILLLFLLCSIANTEDELTVKTYPVKWVRATEVLEPVNILIGGKGKAFKYSAGNELIISTTDALHKQIATLLKDLDHPVPNVRLDIVMGETAQTVNSGLGVKGSGKVVVSKKGVKTHYDFKPTARHQTTTETLNTRQSILIQSGREGSLHIGEEIPYAEWLFYYGRSHGYIDWDFKFETKRTGALLVANAQVLGSGPLISITLTPEIRTLIGKKYRRFRFTKVSTTVTARDGQPITIGGGGQNREFYNKFLTGFSRTGNIRSLNITLTPHIMNADGTRTLTK
jgi:type II secretory pathway component GspD/PulD (secretin)